MTKNRVFKIIFLSFLLIFIASLLIFTVYFFAINKKLDLSLIKPGASSITKIYYFDYEDRENRIGSAKELKEEQIFLNKSEWSSIYNMPKNLLNAFIAIEDKRFYEHKGVDLLRSGKAILNYIFGSDKSSFGGSTITQQLIKNLTGDNQATPKRKLEEILRAFYLETKLSKNEILETYLNIVYLSQNTYGVSSGAEIYFNKNVEDLSLSECASLAAIIKNPTKYDPYENYENNIKRRNVVLKQMLNESLISYDEYAEAIDEELIINQNIENENKSGTYSWFTETVINDVSDDLASKNSISKEAARKLILKGGLNIYTTLDKSIQDKATEVYENYSKYILPQNGIYPESACVILDPYTSDILAVVGGKGSKSGNMIFNRATSAKRPPGSVLKPLSVYAPAIDKNLINYATIIEDSPVTTKNGEPWPKNSPDKYRGNLPICFAVERSINTVAVKVLKNLGHINSINYLNKFGININTEKDKNDSSLALGQLTDGETLLNVTNAYTAFTNGGKVSKPNSYLYVTDNYGNKILENNHTSKRVISSSTAEIMTKMLQGVISSGTGKLAKLNNPNVEVAGKTGTSSNNYDKWFIGYTPDYVCGVWTGFDMPSSLNYANNPSCLLFKAIFDKIYDDENETSRFTVTNELISKDFCFDSGEAVSEGCIDTEQGSKVIKGYFKIGTEPSSVCKFHKNYEIKEKKMKKSLFSTLKGTFLGSH